MSLREILFLSHRIPFPPDRGDKIRSHHLLKALGRLAPVHVATMADDPRDLGAEPELAAVAASHRVVRRGKPLSLAGVQAILAGKPVSLTAFHDARLQAYVDHVLATRPIDAIVGFSSQMGQYIPASFAGRVLFDFVDVDSAKFEAYAQDAAWPMRWVNAREARLLAAEEARIARRAQVSLLVSPQEAALFAARLDPADRAACRVIGLRNGIDSATFDPLAAAPEPRLLDQPGPRLIFTGQMDYPPNVAAVERTAREILPLVRQRFPQTTLHVVGRNPVDSLRALHGRGGVRIWGEVEDIRSWLAAADLALVPLGIARGIQNKVLEAMAMRLPLVLTSGAATGIGALDGRDFLIADSSTDLASATVRVLSNPDFAVALGQAARRHVVEQMSWEATLAPLGDLLGVERGADRDAA